MLQQQAPISILQVYSTDFDRGGGGGIATYRLHLGFKRAGHIARILCRRKTVHSADSIQLPRPSPLEQNLAKITGQLGLNDIHNISSFQIPKHAAYREADVLFLTSFRDGFSYLALPALTRDKPAVLTLHDIWPFTGHCAVAYDCTRWKTGCGNCPYPEVIPAIKRDATHIEWKLKDWAYSRANLAIVSRSTPVSEQAQQSMLGRFPIHQIPGGIPADVLEPLDPDMCRQVLGIPKNKRVLMFSALSMAQHWKGSDLLLEALHGLPASLKAETVLLLLGGHADQLVRSTNIEIYNLGRVMNDRLKAIAYSAADLFICPSRAEAFGMVALESLSCGTPVVVFGIGGALDYVKPGLTGYLAEPEDSVDLRNGILQLLEDHDLAASMGRQGRQMVEKEYTLELEVQRYLDLFRQLLQGSDS